MTPVTYDRRLSWRIASEAAGVRGAALLSAGGLILVGLADRRGQLDESGALLLFWLGLVAVWVPPAAVALAAGAGRATRIAVIAWLGLALYLVKVLQSPLAFTFHDEFSTMRSTAQLRSSGHLLTSNPLIPIHPWYPGLELITSAISSLADVRVFVAGVIVVGIAHVLLVVLLYVFFERLARSERIGAVAALIYMTNPNFVFFDAQFAYESMALALAALVLVFAFRPDDEPAPRRRLAVIGAACLALAATHHLSSYIVLAFLAAVVIVSRRRGDLTRSLTVVAGVFLLALIAWTAFVGPRIWDYLVPVFHRAWTSAVGLVEGHRGSKTLFHSNEGGNAWWQELLAVASIGLVLATAAFGLRLVRPLRARSVVLVLSVSVLAYPVFLLIRLTEAGTEISNRSSEFIFVPIAFVGAFAVVELLQRSLPGATPAVLAFLVILLGGGIVIGWAPWGEVPGHYLVAADSRSIEPVGVAAADWASRSLPSRSRIVVDRTNGLLMGSYGLLDPQIGLSGRQDIARILLSPTYGPVERMIIRRDRIAYVVVDRRLTTALPLVGYYVEEYEPQAFTRRRPVSVATMDKFARVSTMSRLFDDGPIQVYGTGR